MCYDKKALLSHKAVVVEASRCLLCYDAPCSKACPAGTNPEKFIRSLRLKNIRGAAETIRQANILGGVCALVCEYDKLCEEACSNTAIDKAINIGGIQAYIIEQERIMNQVSLKKEVSTDLKVACIGAGPASIACAAYLVVKGVQVTIFDKNEKPGGVLTYGICPSRLSQDVIDYDIGHLKQLGVKFEQNICFGKDFSISELKQAGFMAIFFGLGLWQSKKIEIPGITAENVYDALNFLYLINTNLMCSIAGLNVIVIGGGDVAMDCALAAKNNGAENVTILYRRSLPESPACSEQKKSIQLCGINFISNFIPKEIHQKDNKVVSLSATGRDNYSTLNIKADIVVYAIGQTNETDFGKDNDRVKLLINKHDLSKEGLFAGGDMLNGGKSVVQAVADGKEKAKEIYAYLLEKEKKDVI